MLIQKLNGKTIFKTLEKVNRDKAGTLLDFHQKKQRQKYETDVTSVFGQKFYIKNTTL